MSVTTQQTIPQDKFLRIAVNLLYKGIIDVPRTRAKRLFAELDEGRTVALAHMTMDEQGGEVRVDLNLNKSEFRGRLNFGAFKASVATLIAEATQALQAEKAVPVFTAEGRDSHILFGVIGVTVEDEQPNALGVTVDTGGPAGVINLTLMYLDPAQFVRQPGVTTA